MSEQSDGGVVERQGRKRGRAALTELVLIVRPPGTPTAIRVRMYNFEDCETRRYCLLRGRQERQSCVRRM